jgi:hypothetical protein
VLLPLSIEDEWCNCVGDVNFVKATVLRSQGARVS